LPIASLTILSATLCSPISRGFAVRTLDDVELVRREFESRCLAIGRKVALIVNYDGFTLDPAVSDAYFSMVAYLQQRYYATASRYTTSAFMRLKLGASLADRSLAPHVFETLDESRAFLASRKDAQ
jgi:propionate CoA-transferase